MQTFLPLPSIKQTVRILDYRRLGKQRVEASQILRALRGESKGWANHPAALMWKGHEAALEAYRDACIIEWVRRGYKSTMPLSGITGPLPCWFGDHAFHAAHRSNLLRKDPVFYGQYGWTEPLDLPYVWPTP